MQPISQYIALSSALHAQQVWDFSFSVNLKFLLEPTVRAMPADEDEVARVQLSGILSKRPVCAANQQGGLLANKFYRRYVHPS